MLITEGSMLYWNLQAYIVTFTLSDDVAGNLGTIGNTALHIVLFI